MANKKNKAEDYRSLDDVALQDKINEETLRLKKLSFAHTINPIENPMAIRGIRRFIAQLKTEQNKRKSAASN